MLFGVAQAPMVLFIVDFFILRLEGYDVVLGTQCLRTLGPIQWDFERLMMAFTWGGKERVTLVAK